MKNRKGFTLIELLAVIVILAIIALIATPVILDIIDDARKSSEERSIELFKNSINNAVANLFIKNPALDLSGSYTTTDGKILINTSDSTKTITLDYTGDRVICDVIEIDSNGKVDVSGCKVGTSSVPENSEEPQNIIEITDESCFEYTSFSGEIVITGYKDSLDICPRRVYIPETINNKPVVNIARFSNNNIDFISFPNSMKTISGIISSTSLSEVDFSRATSLESILSYAFSSLQITSLDFSEATSLMEIQEGAFASNKITRVVFAKNGKTYPTLTIGTYAFDSNNISEIVWGNRSYVIGVASFRNNSLTTVTLPVTQISDEAFAGNYLTNVLGLENAITIGKKAFAYNNLTNVNLNKAKVIDEYAFAYNDLKTVRIGEDVTNINTYAFRDSWGSSSLYHSSKRYGPNELESVIINSNSSSVSVNSNAFNGFTGTICWLKDNPNCGN